MASDRVTTAVDVPHGTANGAGSPRSSPGTPPWRTVAVAWSISIGGTLVLGGAAYYLLVENVWLIAVASLMSLFAAGFYLARRTGESEPLQGALLAVLFFGVVAAVLFGGTLLEELPDPLPGLDIGDSTFYFVWPLLQMVAAVAGSVVGGWISANGGSHGR